MQAAALLTGNAEAGRELLERALIETYLEWREAKQAGTVETVRRRLDDLAGATPASGPPTTVEIT